MAQWDLEIDQQDMFIHTGRGGEVREEAAGDEELLGGGNSQQLQPLQQLQEEDLVGVEEHFGNIQLCENGTVWIWTIDLLKRRANKKFRKSDRLWSMPDGEVVKEYTEHDDS